MSELAMIENILDYHNSVKEGFEEWYKQTYWDWHASKPNVEYDCVKDCYNHFDVNLAYDSFKAGFTLYRSLMKGKEND